MYPFFSSKSQILFKQNSHFHVNYTKAKKKKSGKEKSDMRKKPKKDIKAFYENLDCATKSRCGLRPLLCVQSQALFFDLVHRITVYYDYNGYNFVDI